MATGVPRLWALPRGGAGKFPQFDFAAGHFSLSVMDIVSEIMSQTSVPEVGIWQLLYNHGVKPFPENHGIS